jgi:hypothetical protein
MPCYRDIACLAFKLSIALLPSLSASSAPALVHTAMRSRSHCAYASLSMLLLPLVLLLLLLLLLLRAVLQFWAMHSAEDTSSAAAASLSAAQPAGE